MIIRYPTGFYGILNKSRQIDNITWYISSNDPPRDRKVTIKIPVAEEIYSATHQITINDRRNAYGDLVYIINEANNISGMSLTKMYVEGDVLDFETKQSDKELSIARSNAIQSRHDLNKLNLPEILDNNDVNKLQNAIDNKRLELEKLFASINNEISMLETDLKEYQKKLNEANKILNAAKIIDDRELIHKIESKINEYGNIINQLMLEHKNKVEMLREVVDDIIKINMVIR